MACSQQGFTFNLPCEVAIARYSPSKLGSTLAYSQLFDSAVLFNITFADGKPRIITVSQTVPVSFLGLPLYA